MQPTLPNIGIPTRIEAVKSRASENFNMDVLTVELVLMYSRVEDSRNPHHILEWNANRLLYTRVKELIKLWPLGAPGWLGRLSVRLWDFGSGHDLTAREFEPRVGLCADRSEPGACFRFCVPPLCLPHSCSVSLCLSKINVKKNFFKDEITTWNFNTN